MTLSVLAALHHEGELGLHVRAARRNGLTREEIVEVLLQVGVYAGVPAANRAFAVAQRYRWQMAAISAPNAQQFAPSAMIGPGAGGCR